MRGKRISVEDLVEEESRGTYAQETILHLRAELSLLCQRWRHYGMAGVN
jgi:hypothetical protein